MTAYTRSQLEEMSVLQMAAAIEVEMEKADYFDRSEGQQRLLYFRALARAAFRVIPDFALNLGPYSGPSDRPLTIEEMRRAAHYLAETMGLHSAAGKLQAKAALLERIVDGLMAYRGEPSDRP